MFSPRQSASFIDSKMVSIVASACFCVMPRFDTRMLIRSLFSIVGTLPRRTARLGREGGGVACGSAHLQNPGRLASWRRQQGAAMPQDFGEAARDGRSASCTHVTFFRREEAS